MNQAQQKSQYLKNYEEFNLLGRGNYGSAFLVKNNIDGNSYVAKKMMLEGMAEKQILMAWGEIEILKKFNDLNIPFIVEYKECFHFQNTLIIVMQYCQHGDLTTFLKNWKKRGQLLDERVIVNWFIQLLFGVKTLHSKNVLHRDLKAANVFLTSNKTLKIGDFGISKVLDNTSAKTFVGTPYYLSPQVCQNRPYNLASDIWALGCIIYELCTLTYPFQASNLLGLAMKILSDEVKPISNKYSPQLNQIIMKIFTKNQKHRITIDEILKSPYIKKHMATFVEDQQKINKLIQIGKKNIKPQQQQQKPVINNQNNEQTMKTINSVMQNTRGKQSTLSYSQSLTPKQRMILKKQQQANKRAQQLRLASLKNQQFRNFAKQKKQSTLATSNTSFFLNSQSLQRQIQNENKQKAQLSKTKTRLQKMQDINFQELSQTLNKIKTMKGNVEFQEVEMNQSMGTFNVNTIKKNQINKHDDRPINPKKHDKYIQEQINQEQDLEEYYDQGFQEYIEDQPQMKSTATKEQFQQIKAFYDHQIGNGNLSPTKKSKVAQAFKSQQINVPSTPGKKVSSKVDHCIELVGQKRYKQLYSKVKNEQIDYKLIKKSYNQTQRQVIKTIDQIIFYQSS